MTSSFHCALGGAMGLALGACSSPGRVDPAANLIDTVGITSDQRMPPPLEPRHDDRGRVSDTANQEISMPEPDATPPPPTAKPRAPARREVILPSPTQPPAEVDPVRPPPDDAVPL